MINLACNKPDERTIKLTSETVRLELVAAGVTPVECELDMRHNEVPSTYTGKIGHFTFRRLWYYYSVRGPFIVDVAQEYWENNQLWKKDVRADGHCGCPPPNEWCRWWVEGNKTILPVKEKQSYKNLMKEEKDGFFKHHYDYTIFSDTPQEVEGCFGVVDCFHVDSQEGLNLLASVIKDKFLGHKMYDTIVREHENRIKAKLISE